MFSQVMNEDLNNLFLDKGCENNPVLISEHFDRPKQSSGFQMTFVSHGYGKLRNPDYLDESR